jgi:hypothetical protein
MKIASVKGVGFSLSCSHQHTSKNKTKSAAPPHKKFNPTKKKLTLKMT